MDRLSPSRRSWLMSRVRGKHTSPELIVRRLAHAMGYRFRLHKRELPGSPDLVFAGRKAVIFVHGCFWHRHPDCRKATTPKSREAYWAEKFDRNVERDRRVIEQLGRQGWKVLVVWECEAKDQDALKRRLEGFLD